MPEKILNIYLFVFLFYPSVLKCRFVEFFLTFEIALMFVVISLSSWVHYFYSFNNYLNLIYKWMCELRPSKFYFYLFFGSLASNNCIREFTCRYNMKCFPLFFLSLSQWTHIDVNCSQKVLSEVTMCQCKHSLSENNRRHKQIVFGIWHGKRVTLRLSYVLLHSSIIIMVMQQMNKRWKVHFPSYPSKQNAFSKRTIK